MSICLVFPGDSQSARTWSGTPSGLARGLEELGIEVLHVSAEPPLPLGLAVTLPLALLRLRRCRGARGAAALRASRAAVREGSSEVAALRSAVLDLRLRRLAGSPALIQIGTGYTVPSKFPIVTVEDMTVPQARALGLPEWQVQSARTVSLRIERQRRAYEQARACCVASEWARDSLTSHYGISPEKVRVVGLGRNHNPRPVPRDWATPRFLFVGRDFERKGGPAVLRAFGRLHEGQPGATLDVVGEHPRLALPGVRGHGRLSLADPACRARLEALFEASTCLVMPSLFEPFGIAHAEAAAAGVPSIGTTVGGAADVIGPDAGILVPPRDGTSLWEAMRRLSDPQTAAAMGAAALARSRRFTWGAVAGRVVAAIESGAADRQDPRSAPSSSRP
jgi:glycosyltransferase involved in cell wall biosynthesis